MKSILFIINPNSGTGKYKIVVSNIKKYIDKNLYKYKIIFTERPLHATEICTENRDKYDIIVAVGGDGTINEVVQALVNHKTILGIIPTGSGNGLTRFLKIPQSSSECIKLINKSSSTKIDTLKINNQIGINVSGVGFDGKIAHMFANFGKRGFLSYIKIVIKEFFSYNEKKYSLTYNNKSETVNAFLVSFANSGQFGNNAYIAPKADISDGLIDVVILKKFSIIGAPLLAFRLFNKTIDKSKYCRTFRTDNITIESQTLDGHIDGEPVNFKDKIVIKVLPESINVIC